MRHKLLILFFIVISSVVGTVNAQQGTAAPGEQFLGTWRGTWDGGGLSRAFELTLERATDGTTVAKVLVMGDPSYHATLGELAFDGANMTAKYDFPPQPETEVLLGAAFNGSGATGTWSLREKASGFEVVAGSWQATKY